MRRWLAPSHGHRIWAVLASLIPAAMTVPIFIPNWRSLVSPQILTWTLVFIAINPFVEEFYRRPVFSIQMPHPVFPAGKVRRFLLTEVSSI